MGLWDRLTAEGATERATARMLDQVAAYEKLHGLEPGTASPIDLDGDRDAEMEAGG